MSLHLVILAAGNGTRMRSSTPKVLHKLAGKSMLERVLDTAEALEPDGIHVIIGYEGERIKRAFSDRPVNWVWQKKQLGTGHAVMQALPHIPEESQVLVLSADVPLIQLDLLRAMVAHGTPSSASRKEPLALLLAILPNPKGLGRVLRDVNGAIQGVVEEKDATDAQRSIQEIYSGTCCATASDLAVWLPKLSDKNIQEEYYLTDIMAMAAEENCPITCVHAPESWMIQGVNDRSQLEGLERIWQEQRAFELMMSGVTLADRKRIDIRGELTCGQDVYLDANIIFEGKVHIGQNCRIGANCVLTNVTLGDNTVIEAHSVLDDCVIGEDCKVGPFARIRPGTVLGDRCKIGNFVETKKAVFDDNSQASHLSYLGDVTIGKKVNIGAGTITCNYDGINKHQTVIEDGAFIGSDTQLVAPVTIGKNATVGAGSSIRKSVPAGGLTLTASKQTTLPDWMRPEKKVE
ncbi:MAG: bifunctional UDP-N-acetylglucosamine diphosphorylase/glucosamine-1-phosphate N-acetyltransferase GlmU [Legionellaceae bacterium]|nr:bifunctional UDP-N-acetylglucosamine diphosphorylase/glucosamine-1-phosphate N-acetyltransferase GlmU [Legionellaceae bacterium]